MAETDNKTIAKNATLLYLRMFLTVIVSLYTSRVVLQVLGVDDYGVYNVVGGVVAMFNFLNASMSGATSRFLTFELGKGNKETLRDTFASALIIHVGIALAMLLIAETVGLYFVANKLVIAPERMEAAHWVYQFAIFSMVVGTTQVPYNACVMAHERMGIYAYMEMLSVFLKLGLVIALQLVDSDKLILYAGLTAGVNLLIALLYRFYCLRNFAESHFRWRWQSERLRPMLSFSGWGVVGSLSEIGNVQGSNFLLNIFFGTALNAANGIAVTVQGILRGFMFNVITAYRPQLVKKYAEGDFYSLQELVQNATIFSVATCFLLSLPLFVEADYVLQLWLGNVPPMTAIFLRISLVTNIFLTEGYVLAFVIGATGKVRNFNLRSMAFNLMPLLLTYFAYKMGGNAAWAYWLMCLATLGMYVSNMQLLRRYAPSLSVRQYLKATMRVSLLPLLLTFAVLIAIYYSMDESFVRLLLVSLSSLFVYAGSFYVFALSKSQQAMVRGWLQQRLLRKK